MFEAIVSSKYCFLHTVATFLNREKLPEMLNKYQKNVCSQQQCLFEID